jgi:rubredoxin
MHPSVISPDESGPSDTEFDDIEGELCCSAREASFGSVPFANIDFAKVTTEICRKRMATQRRDSRGPADSTSLRHCPECGGKKLIPVLAGHSTNFFCPDCVFCWHVEAGRAARVNPWTCPECQLVTTAGFERREVSHSL